jgi:hypothetical protein
MLRTKLAFLAASILLVTGTGFAQSERVSLSLTADDARPMMRITNNYSSPITVFVVTVDLTTNARALTRFYFDAYANWKHDYPIPTGDYVEMPVPHAVGRPAPTPVFRAALFEDGTTWGDATWVDELLRRREILLDRLREVSETLREISAQGRGRDEALAFLERKREARAQANAGASAEERLLHDRAFDIVIRNLGGDLRINGKIPDTFTAISRLQKRFDDWRSHVESAKPPSRPPVRVPQAFRPRPGVSTVSARLLTASLECSSDRNPRLSLRFRSLALPQDGCLAFDASNVIEGPDTCGHQLWELKVNVSSQTSSVTYDFGSALAHGVCTGGYTNCSGSFVSQSFIEGGRLRYPVAAPPNQRAFYWALDMWSNEYFDCACTDPYPQGVDEEQFNAPYPTPIYYVDCPS